VAHSLRSFASAKYVLFYWSVLTLFLLALGILLQSQQPETMSLLETELYAPSFPREVRATLEANLGDARAAYQKDPKSADAAIAYVRAQVAIGHVGDALESIAHAIEANPDDQRLVLERAKALVIYRKFDSAERDARKVADTLPEANCTLGLALYLKMQFAESRAAFDKCPAPELFKYLADRRAGGTAVARPDLSVLNETPPAPDIKMPGAVSAHADTPKVTMTAAYVQAAETIAAEKKGPAHGRKDPAEDTLRQIVEKQENRWMEPIYIAAEADYARILKAEGKFKKPADRKKKKG
jgi:tetratricopeptide (TPR) repeat protein